MAQAQKPNYYHNMLLVTCAIIEHKEKVLVVQRNPHQKFANKWEFPGGKLEPGETYSECIKREISEELAVEIEIIEQLDQHPILGIGILIPFRCFIKEGEITLLEHQDMQWLLPEEVLKVDLSEADISLANSYAHQRRKV